MSTPCGTAHEPWPWQPLRSASRTPSARPQAMALPSLPAWPANTASRIAGSCSRTIAALPPKPLQASSNASQARCSSRPSGRRMLTPSTRSCASHHSSCTRASREQRGAGALGGGLQRRHQRHAGALRQRVHAAHRVAGVEKAVEQLERDAVTLLQRIERRCNCLGVCGHEVRRRAAMRLGLDVGGEACGAVVVHAGRALHRGAGGGDEARRQRGRALR